MQIYATYTLVALGFVKIFEEIEKWALAMMAIGGQLCGDDEGRGVATGDCGLVGGLG